MARRKVPLWVWVAMLTAHTLFIANYIWPSGWLILGFFATGGPAIIWAHRVAFGKRRDET